MKNEAKEWLSKILKKFAQKVLSKNPDLDIIGVTGSVGKSTTKEAIYSVLSKSKSFKGKVIESTGNLNTEIGLPLAILGYQRCPTKFEWPFAIIELFLKSYFSNHLKGIKILVLEYAADKPGDIKHLCSITRPNIVIITKIGAAHTEFFGDIKRVMEEKSFLAQSASENGLVLLNKNDDYPKHILDNIKAQIEYFNDQGIDSKNEIAKKIGKYFKLSDAEIEQGLKNIKKLPGRLNILKGQKQSIIIDDTYNANPESMKQALEFLKKYDKKGRKVAVLGDMLELGDLENESHQEIAKLAQEKADETILVGLKFQKFESGAWFEDSVQAGDYILKNLKKNDIILVKGSNAMRMDRIVERLKENNGV